MSSFAHDQSNASGQRDALPSHDAEPSLFKQGTETMAQPAQQLVEQPSGGGEIVRADDATLMAVIARAAADPNTDVDKLERLMGMHERFTARQAEADFIAAMNATQEAMKAVRADASNPQTKSRYASYAALDRAVRPIYSANGFSLTFDTADGAPPDHIRVVCKVSHSGGHKDFPHLDMPADGKGAKGGDVMTKTHAIGSAVTYGKRYLLGMIFNIAVGDDDDGNAAGGGKGQTISQAQGEEIQALMEDVGADRDKFLNYLRVSRIGEIPASQFKNAIAALEKKRRA